jgi:cobalt-zinc-cadmium efflux system membrane fusion protein
MKYQTKLALLGVLLSVMCSVSYADNKAVAQKKVSKAQNEYVTDVNSPNYANLKIETLQEIPAPATEPLNGKVALDENFTSRVSSPILGRATKIYVQIGARVKAGQVLMSIDSPDLATAIADARKANADLELKRKAFERNKLLLEGGVIASKELEISQADLNQALAESERAQARLRNLNVGRQQQDAETYYLRAPISGILVDQQINPGSEVRPDAPNPLFTITNPSHLWVLIDLPERNLGKVSVGQSISVSVDAYPDEQFSGKVLSIGTVLDATTRRVQVRCAIDGKDKLKPEMFARITPLSASQSKVLRLPNSALITEGLYSYVFVENSPGRIQKRRVELDLQERNFSTVKTGLKAGERVVTAGAILINSELSTGK